MPQFKVAKTDDISKLNNNALTEDKLYIYKETNTLGRLFYDYGIDIETNEPIRLEIGSLENIYQCTDTLVDDVVVISINKLRKYLSTNEFSTVNINEIQINSLVVSAKSIYNIRDIDRSKDKLEVTLRRIYTQQDLTWNDYYE